MHIYDHPTFQMACQQFDLVADRLEIPLHERDRVKYPKRSMSVAVPIRRDDGRARGIVWRVQRQRQVHPQP